ncbi:MAG: apolipoprotein N-acyltransferase [Clostridia bacterium]|nr:apolipoprotein N-acyltransferase [Clostridia bacterium]
MTRSYQRKQLLWMALGGALTGVTLVLPQLGFLQWLTMIPMMIGIYRLGEDSTLSARRMYGYGFLTVLAYYLVIYHWFFNLYPLDFAGLSNASSIGVVLAGWIGLSLLQAILGGLVFLFYRLLGQTGIYERHPLVRPFAFAALWTLFEWSSTVGWTGVPWGRLCLGQIECLPILQGASLLGSYFVSFMILLVNGLLAYAVLYRARATLCGTLAIASVGSMLVFGAVRLSIPEKEESIQVAVIQGNIDSHEKWDSSTGAKTKEIHARLTRAAAQEGAEIIVWSETAIPYPLNQNQAYQTYLSELAVECEVTLLVGAICKTDGKEYNAIYQVDPDGRIHEEIYAKRHLVPFGEYVPMRSLFTIFLPFLTEISMLEEDLTAGTDSNLFSVGESKIGGLICFDSIYELLALDAARDGADLIALGTNDSWFRDSAAVYMHFSQARLRAIETGLPVARAANTGISGLITKRGEVVDFLPPLTEGYLAGSLSAKGAGTLYTAVGNLFVWLCAAFYLLLLFIGFSTRKRTIAHNYKYF